MLLYWSKCLQSFKYFCRITTIDEKYMQQCLILAQKGFGNVSPNPMVGCVVVHNGQKIAESWHKVYGGPHAEVNALQQIDSDDILKECTVYVSLEPCSHHGKTPPCADLLISKKVKKVVVGMHDPFPEVSGKGIQKLRDAGIEVQVGILEKECRKINKRFLVNQTKSRPYVILKWAESADGYIGKSEKVQISGLAAQTRLHKWRSEEDAFLIGTNTLLIDDPQLNTRLWKGKDPIRIAIDFTLRSEGQLLKFHNGNQRTIILNGKSDADMGKYEYVRINDRSIPTILSRLHELKIGSIVVEGGTTLLESFLKSGLYDEVRVFKSKEKKLYDGIPAPKMDFAPVQTEDLLDDWLLTFE